MNLADFHAMSLDELDDWLKDHNYKLATLEEMMESGRRIRALAYRVLKEKMAR